MSIINFFGKMIKPLRMKNTGQLNPAPTQIIDEHLSCIRQFDVNLWFYKKDEDIVAFDAGYDDFPAISSEFEKIRLDPRDVRAVFLTHADMDHAGGISDGRQAIFPEARIYLHQDEIGMLNGETKRFIKGPFRFKNPLRCGRELTPLRDGEIIQIGTIKIETIYTPGHTKGHCCYLIDDEILISGDCLAFNKEGGYAFFKFFNLDHQASLKSAQKLKERFAKKPPRMICTGHSGLATDQANYFRHINQAAYGTRKQPFDLSAPGNVFACND